MPYVVGDRRSEGRVELQAAFETPQDYPATKQRDGPRIPNDLKPS